MNLYGFASGDPVNFSDPFGLLAACDNPPKPICDILRSAASRANQLLRFAETDRLELPLMRAGERLSRYGLEGTALTNTTLTVYRQNGEIKADFRGEVHIDKLGGSSVTPFFIPDPVVKSGTLNLSNGDLSMRGHVFIAEFTVMGNLIADNLQWNAAKLSGQIPLAAR